APRGGIRFKLETISVRCNAPVNKGRQRPRGKGDEARRDRRAERRGPLSRGPADCHTSHGAATAGASRGSGYRGEPRVPRNGSGVMKKLIAAGVVALSMGVSGTALADPIKIGLITTLSGGGAGLGVDARDGFLLALKNA